MRDIYDKYKNEEEEAVEHIKSVHYERQHIPEVAEEKKEESSPDESF